MSTCIKYGRPIAFQRIFTGLSCDGKKIGVTGALMLSQACYWSVKTVDGWFWKTADEWEEETGLTRREQETARKKLVSLGIMAEEKRGVPCKLFFKIDETRLDHLVNLVSTNPPNWNGGKRQTNTKTTSKTTSKSTPPAPQGGSNPTDKNMDELDPLHRRIILIFQKRIHSNHRDRAETNAWRNNKSKIDEQSLALVEQFYNQPKSKDFDQTWRRKTAPATLMNNWISQVELAEAYLDMQEPSQPKYNGPSFEAVFKVLEGTAYIDRLERSREQWSDNPQLIDADIVYEYKVRKAAK